MKDIAPRSVLPVLFTDFTVGLYTDVSPSTFILLYIVNDAALLFNAIR